MPKPTLHIIGTGEAFDVGIGNNSCLLTGPVNFLFDCGYQIPERIWQRKDYREIDAVFFSHLHADHCFGIIPLVMRFWEEGRRTPLWVIGRRGVGKYVRELFELGYPGLFRKIGFLRFKEVSPHSSWRWKGMKVRLAHTSHSVENLAIRLDGSSWSFGFSGDGQITDESRALFQDVDFLVHELYSLKPKTPVHCDFETLSKFVQNSSIGRIGVTHHARGERRILEKKIASLKDRRWIALRPGVSFRIS